MSSLRNRKPEQQDLENAEASSDERVQSSWKSAPSKVLLAALAVAACICTLGYVFLSEGPGVPGDFADLYGPPSGWWSSKWALDKGTHTAVLALHATDPAKARSIRQQLEVAPLNVEPRVDLCEELDLQTTKPRNIWMADIVECSRTLMRFFEFANTTGQNERLQSPYSYTILACAAGEKLSDYADGMPDRMHDAITFMEICASESRGDAEHFHNLHVRNYARLISNMQEAGYPASQITAHFDQAKRVLDVTWPNERSIHIQVKGIRAKAFWEPTEIPWLAGVASRWQEIRDELYAYLAKPSNSMHSAGAVQLAPEQTWETILLLSPGGWNEQLCKEHFPLTCTLLLFQPELDARNFQAPESTSGRKRVNAKVMVNLYRVAPGGRIHAHFGQMAHLVASLGLRVPTGSSIRVGGENRTWKEGEWLVFDDSYVHEVVNDASEPRFVLAARIIHPDCCPACTAREEITEQ
eukprot:TRINITY_DN52993_c0_g1_i1.p1 TRINITY_DN52993_c0_g1~~TRINITY_DN52993_c0_g1_i1.p1  ORF type:complete len:483 (+),score=41.18 TRINITY_DN52993_c0_g1_i1:48-1451(+)